VGQCSGMSHKGADPKSITAVVVVMNVG
jgi:hypothetical protein